VGQGHEVEVVTAAFAQASARAEDGVHYRHVGDGRGYFRSILSYQARLAPLMAGTRLRARRYDLVVEDFVPPFSTLGLGARAGLPSVGLVQGFFAAQKAREYGVPVSLLTAIERWGTRRHRELIAMSADLADALRVAAPASRVSIIGLGLPHDEIAQALDQREPLVPGRIVFLGRLEFAQKGLDLLLEAVRGLRDPAAHLVIAGDGRDRPRVEELVRQYELQDRVSLIGRVSGVQKWRLLAGAQVCVVPSRYETFGLSALEALACGTPVVGFDIPGLRETVPASAGRLTAPFDVEAMTATLGDLLADLDLCERLGRAGAIHAEAYRWEAVTASQLAVYEAAIAG
jgi:glycogen(starch) synthase